jgi:hypothetical protein
MDPISTQLLAASQKEQQYDGCLAVTHSSSPYITVYPFTRASGFGTKYSNPSTLPGSGTVQHNSVIFTTDGTVIAWPSNTASIGANLFFYSWSKATGFGARITQGTGPTSDTIYGSVTTKPSEFGGGYHYILFAGSDGSIWRYHVASGASITQVNTKNTGVGGLTLNLRFSNAGNYVLGGIGNPRFYPWTDGWNATNVNLGTASESSQGSGSWNMNDWHPSDTVVAIGSTSSSLSGLRALNFAGGWGTVINNATSFMASLTGLRFSASGKTVFTSSTNSPYLEAHAFDQTTGFGSKFSNPSTLPPGPSYTVAVSKTNDLVGVSSTTSPYVAVYPWNDSTGFGVKYSDPGSLPSNGSRSLAFM